MGLINIALFRDINRRRQPWTLGVILFRWPDAEQEMGALVRSLAYIEIGRGHWFRYSPNRAEYWLRLKAPRP